MAFTIPNVGDASHVDQAEPDAVDFAILLDGIEGDGVISGCAVTAKATPDMTVAVASGTVRLGGSNSSVTAGNLTIGAASATNPRFDLIAVNSSGTKSVVAGSAAGNPVFPQIPASSIIIAAVYVPANDTAINSTQITDKRVTVATGADHGSLTGLTDDDHTQYVLDTDIQALDFLIGTASGYLSGEIAVGTTPGGELGGTWAAPTVDTTHAGGIHAVGANPTASIGLSTINGSAATFLRSDGASPIDQNIAPTWTGVHLASAAYRNSTYLRVGSTSAPSNVTAGDFTAIRGHFGTDGAFGTNVVLESVGRVKATGTFTTTTQLDSQLYVTGTVTGNTNQFAGLGIHLDTTFNGSA